jgi:hypothetical protein
MDIRRFNTILLTREYNNAEVDMQQQVDIILTSVQSFVLQLGQFLPKLIGAIVILIVGWLLSKLLLLLVVRGLKLIKFDRLTDTVGIDDFLKKGGIKKTTVEVLGVLIYWLAILVTLLATFNVLGLTQVADLFARIAQFIPNVIVAVIILTIGLYFARFVADAVTAYSLNVGMVDAVLIGRLTRYAVTIFVVVVALEQSRIGESIPGNLLYIIVGGIVLAFAIAFGLGGQKWAADALDKMNGKTKK